MTRENDRYKGRLRRFIQGRDSEIDRMIAETERSIVNTRKFLEQIHASQRSVRVYVEDMKKRLEDELAELKIRRKFRREKGSDQGDA